MISPTTIDIRIGMGDAFILKAQSLNQSQGRKVVRHNEGFHPMDRILLKEEFKTFVDAFQSVALMLILMAEFISKAAALVGSFEKILKAEGANDFIRIVL
jgi:hypothetical protein